MSSFIEPEVIQSEPNVVEPEVVKPKVAVPVPDVVIVDHKDNQPTNSEEKAMKVTQILLLPTYMYMMDLSGFPAAMLYGFKREGRFSVLESVLDLKIKWTGYTSDSSKKHITGDFEHVCVRNYPLHGVYGNYYDVPTLVFDCETEHTRFLDCMEKAFKAFVKKSPENRKLQPYVEVPGLGIRLATFHTDNFAKLVEDLHALYNKVDDSLKHVEKRERYAFAEYCARCRNPFLF